ncbi:hypothetical protein ACFOMD_03750 [Sphingoaurantiacus capsulatus]|uniref:Uncharacterized protein n=1 Tax=Sphingoaurantiacus capsulatus TaxID=1771310 RepID=A0ABV7X8N4_9SPHN
MAAEILLHPDNRLLGFSTNDFSFYGAQPADVTTVTVRPAPASEGLAPPVDTGDGAGGAPAPMSEPSPPADMATIEIADPIPADVEAPAATSSVAAGEAAAPLVPNADGAGSLSSVAFSVLPATSQLSAENAAAETAPAALSGVAPSSGDMSAATDALTTSTMLDMIGITAPLSAAVDALAIDALGVAAQAPPTVVDAVGTTTSLAADTAASLVGDVVAPVTAVITPVVDSVASAAAPVDAAVGTDLAGADPAAGIATLVDLVTVDNLFDLRQAGVEAAPDPAPSMVDSLMADAVAPPLLGTEDSDDALLATSDAHDDAVGIGI